MKTAPGEAREAGVSVGERPAAANPGTTLSEHRGRWGVWAQGDCAFFEVRDAAEACERYRDALAHAELGVSTHPPCVDGLRARRMAAVVAAARALAGLVSIVGGPDGTVARFTEGEPGERVAAVRALWDALDG